MAWSWDDFSAELGRVLDDEDSDNPAHSEASRLDGLNAALRAMLAYRPLQAASQHTRVSQIAWPADCYRIVAVLATDQDGYQTALSAASLDNPGELLADDSAYWVWNGQISLGATYPAVTLYYQAYYPLMAVNAADIPLPPWAREAVVYRAAAHCLAPNMISRARLGAFHDRQDAPPLANSLIQAADWLIAQFERIMTEHKHAG